jgi:hypothetical protein
MKDPIVESLATIRSIESKEILNEFTAPPGLAAAGKLGGKLLPGVGLALAAQDAYSRQKAGDTTGAAIAGLTGAASNIPVVGTAASLIGTGVQAVRDKMRTGSWMPDEKEIAAGVAKDATAQPAPAVAQAKPAAAPAMTKDQIIAFQKANGLTPDGVIGKNTQAALNAQKTKGTAMSETQRIAELRDRLAQLEQTQQVDEGPLDALKAGWGAAKNFIGGAKAGIQGGAAASNIASGAANLGKAGEKGLAAAQAVKGAGSAVKAAATGNTAKNIAKVGGGAALGAAGMAALGGGAATKPADPSKPTAPKVPGAPATTDAPAAAQTPNAEADPADVAELNKLAAELENSTDPADIALLQRYNGVINAINNRQAGDKRTQAEIAASAGLK